MRTLILLLGLFVGCAPKPALEFLPDDPLKNLKVEISRLRELSFTGPVPTARASQDDVETYVRKQMSEQYADGELEAERKVLTLLGLISENFPYENTIVSLLRDQVAGFYDPALKTLFLASRYESGSPEAESIAAHELTHALQDQHFSLERFLRKKHGDDDQTAATNALIEGDALALMMDYAMRKQGGPSVPPGGLVALMRSAMVLQQKSNPELAAVPSVLLDYLVFPYAYGWEFIQKVREKRGWKGVNAAFKHPPASSEEVLHPEKYLDQSDRPIPVADRAIHGLKSNVAQVITTNVLGEFGLRTILSVRASEDEARRAAAGWGGDRYWLLKTKDGGRDALVVAVIWDTEADAREFEELWQRRPPEERGFLLRNGKRTLIRFNWEGDLANALMKGCLTARWD